MSSTSIGGIAQHLVILAEIQLSIVRETKAYTPVTAVAALRTEMVAEFQAEAEAEEPAMATDPVPEATELAEKFA